VLQLGSLLVAPSSEDGDAVFARTVVLIVDREPNGISVGIVLNRPLEQRVADTSALALLFVTDPLALVHWGGPVGEEAAVLAELTDTRGLAWFHLAKRQERPFPLPSIGLIALAEHPEPFEERIRRARLYLGMCVWGKGQLEAEVERGDWHVLTPTPDEVFSLEPARLWDDLQVRLG
jgi:putative transcriptional regulator